MDPITQRIIMGAAGAGGAADSYWFATIGNSYTNRAISSAADSTGNVYVAGYRDDSNRQAQIVKYSPSGSVLWQKEHTKTNANISFRGVHVDSNDDVILTGQYDGDCQVVKLNSLGNVAWERSFENTGYLGRGAIDSSGNAYVAGFSTSGNNLLGNYDIFLAKLNSSGTVQWQRGLGRTGEYYLAYDVDVDSSDNVIVTSSIDLVYNNFYEAAAAKYNSSGTLQWKKKLNTTNVNVNWTTTWLACATDSSDNIYGVDFTDFDIFVFKLNSSGTVQWLVELDSQPGNLPDEVNDVAVDSSGNVYTAGFTRISGTTNRQGLLLKFNSSGTLQFARVFKPTGSGKDVDFFGITVIDNDNQDLILVGETSQDAVGSTDFLTLKVPNDGSLTGTYGNFEYAAQSRSTTSHTVSSSGAGGLTSYTESHSTQSVSTTKSTTSFTNTTTSM